MLTIHTLISAKQDYPKAVMNAFITLCKIVE